GEKRVQGGWVRWCLDWPADRPYNLITATEIAFMMSGSAIQRPLAVMMSRRILTASPSTPVVQAARTMCDAKIGALLVLEEDGRYIGIVSETDLVRKVLAAEREVSQVLVSEVMMA